MIGGAAILCVIVGTVLAGGTVVLGATALQAAWGALAYNVASMLFALLYGTETDMIELGV